MRGLSKEEIRERRAAVIAKLEGQGHEVVDTIFIDTPPDNSAQALWHLGKSLLVLPTVDAVYFMDGWDRARECRIEYEACTMYGKKPLNAEWRELKKTFSLERTLFECFPDQMLDPRESVEQVANRIIRFCRMRCDENARSWQSYCYLRDKIDRMRLLIYGLFCLVILVSLFKVL